MVDKRFSPGAHAHVFDNVVHGSRLYTDAAAHYQGLGKAHFEHEWVDHAIEYARDHVHCNSMENFWTLLKRTLKGTYVQVSCYHLFRYLDEQARRFNERSDDDRGRFLSTIERTQGRRLDYRLLTGDFSEVI